MLQIRKVAGVIEKIYEQADKICLEK